MAASAFLVTLPNDVFGQTLKEGANAFLCWAFDEADALELAADVQSGDVNAPWADGTGTPIVAPADLEGWRYHIKVVDPSDDTTLAEVTYTALEGEDFDAVGDKLVTALEATAGIVAASYSTPVLNIAETTDGIGDHQVIVNVYPPAADVLKDVDHDYAYSTIVDEGAAGDPLQVTLIDISPSYVYGAFKA